jgi:hypothetical protein
MPVDGMEDRPVPSIPFCRGFGIETLVHPEVSNGSKQFLGMKHQCIAGGTDILGQ